MAVCDLLLTVFNALPCTLSLVADCWILGEALCYVNENITWICNGTTLFLSCTFASLKLLTVKYPLRAGTWSSRVGHKVCAAMWCLELFLYAPTLMAKLYHSHTLHFTYVTYDCRYNVPRFSKLYDWYGILAISFSNIVPYTILIVTTELVLSVARRSAARQGNRPQWSGVLTVLLTVAVLVISQLPLAVVLVLDKILRLKRSTETWRAVQFPQYINIMANFFIYSLTVKSFRRFIKLKISLILPFLGLAIRQQRTLQQQRPLHQQAAHQQARPAQLQGPLQNENPPPQEVIPLDEYLSKQHGPIKEEEPSQIPAPISGQDDFLTVT